MNNSRKNTDELSPRGPEGVPVDAPDNTAPAISPHAVSRMHRGEDDLVALEGSPDYSERTVATDGTVPPRAQGGAGSRATAMNVGRGTDKAEPPPRDHGPNPGHGTRKDAGTPPRGAGDGELQEQPASVAEARQPGADNPKTDE